MFTAIYFPLVASLASAHTPAAVSDLLREGGCVAAAGRLAKEIDPAHGIIASAAAATGCSVHLSDGLLDSGTIARWACAGVSAANCADGAAGVVEAEQMAAAARMQLLADLHLLQGADDIAEDCYRVAQRLIRHSKYETRIASRRNTGWQAFFHQRFGTALACFTRVAGEADLSAGKRFDAVFGCFSVLYAMGHLRQATDMLDHLDEIVAQARGEAGDWQAFAEIAAVLRTDLDAQCALRSRPDFHDHVYWQSSLAGNRSVPRARADVPVAGNGVDDGATAQGVAVHAPAIALLRSRRDYLRALARLAAGERVALQDAMRHLAWATHQNMASYERGVRLELALASLAAHSPQHAELVLAGFEAGTPVAGGQRQLEYLYCMAKMRTAQEREADGQQFYLRYAMAAMQFLREEAQAPAPLPAAEAQCGAAPLDDIGARLPARYRRAYRYLIDNLSRRDLSVREVAAQIGVTERSLQNVFKDCLGATPTEVIRQQRLDRIRAELEENTWGERGVLDAAMRWGIENRSTLVSGYRNRFNEVPSETLRR